MTPRIKIAFILVCLASPSGAQQVTSDQLANQVRSEFLHAWNGFAKYAWGHDAYRPLGKTGEDWYGTPFYLTSLQALDALTLMGFDREADTTREFLATHLSFDKDVYVPVSEFAARIVGALLANYQLTADKRLLALANDLGKRLLPAFVSPTGMPYREVNLKTGAVRGEVCSPADIGTLLIDLGALAMMTDSAAYYNCPKIALLELYKHRSTLDLIGTEINVTTGEWTHTRSRPGSEISAYYMSVLKSAFLFDDADCGQMWQTHYAAINRYLLDSTASGYWYGGSDMNSGIRTETFFGARQAFFPGAQALFRDTGRAERTMQSCFSVWTKYGVQPDLYDYAAGTVKDAGYSLDPELTESIYILYRDTQNPVYLQMGKAVLDSLIRYCRTDEGYTELNNVLTREKADRLDPHFFSGTMKYLYLLFAPPDVLDLSRVIMNSQGHPIRKAW